MKSRITLVLIVFILWPALARAIEGLPPGTDEVLANIQKTMFPPKVHEVSLSPAHPEAGQPAIVTAEVFNDPKLTLDATIEAAVIYSMDQGKTWAQIDMDSDDQRLWTAALPGFPQGTRVLYGIRAVDDSTNVYTETPCLVSSWPPADDACMFDLAADDTPVDDPYQSTPDDYDFLGLKGGMDEDHVYLELTVEGKINPGTGSPINISIYGFALQNPDIGDPSNIITQGFLGIYAPLARAVGGTYPPCMTISMPADEPVFTERNIQCESDGKTRLWYRIDNKQIGKNPSGYINILAADGAILSISPVSGTYYDYTNVSSIARISRSFTVE